MSDGLVVAGLVLCLVLTALGTYVGAYYGRSRTTAVATSITVVEIRTFKTKWEATLFLPASKVESWIKGYPVATFGNPTSN